MTFKNLIYKEGLSMKIKILVMFAFLFTHFISLEALSYAAAPEIFKKGIIYKGEQKSEQKKESQKDNDGKEPQIVNENTNSTDQAIADSSQTYQEKPHTYIYPGEKNNNDAKQKLKQEAPRVSPKFKVVEEYNGTSQDVFGTDKQDSESSNEGFATKTFEKKPYGSKVTHEGKDTQSQEGAGKK